MTAMLLFKATLLWSVLLLAARLLRSAHPADRHRLWTIGFAAVLALPILAPVLPSLEVPIASSWAMPSSDASAASSPTAVAPANVRARQDVPLTEVRRNLTDAGLPTAAPTRHFEWPSAGTLAIEVWLFGAAVAALTLLVSLIRVRRLERTARHGRHDLG